MPRPFDRLVFLCSLVVDARTVGTVDAVCRFLTSTLRRLCLHATVLIRFVALLCDAACPHSLVTTMAEWLCQIHEITHATSTYKVDGARSDVELHLTIGNSKPRRMTLDRVSNQPPTEQEFKSWVHVIETRLQNCKPPTIRWCKQRAGACSVSHVACVSLAPSRPAPSCLSLLIVGWPVRVVASSPSH